MPIETDDKDALFAFAAIERRRLAEPAIVRAAVALEAAPPGPAGLALWEPFIQAVRAYNQAEHDLEAAREAINGRARSRP
jgi:hypothetical protein